MSKHIRHLNIYVAAASKLVDGITLKQSSEEDEIN